MGGRTYSRRTWLLFCGLEVSVKRERGGGRSVEGSRDRVVVDGGGGDAAFGGEVVCMRLTEALSLKE